MPASVLSAFFVFTFITAITPGPNNILALTTGGRAGFRGSIPVLAGICGGFFCVMAICGVLSFSFSVLSASFLQIMPISGAPICSGWHGRPPCRRQGATVTGVPMRAS